MSIARVCDRCRAVYPEGQEGSGTLTGYINVKTERGVKRVEQSMDQCAKCCAGPGVEQAKLTATAEERTG